MMNVYSLYGKLGLGSNYWLATLKENLPLRKKEAPFVIGVLDTEIHIVITLS